MSWTAWEKLNGPQGYEWQAILYERKYHEQLEGGVARISINRPPMNTVNNVVLAEMSAAFAQASRDKTVGAVVVTGVGENFCSGGDVEWEERDLGRVGVKEERKPVIAGTGFGTEQVRQPVIAAVKGWCVGYGNHFAYRCDLTVAADNARFAQNGPRVGSPANGYIIAYLINAVGEKRAREIWFLCRRYTAQEALNMGLINSVVPLSRFDEEVDQWCEEILSLAPGCIEILKASFEMATEHIRGQNWQQRLMYPDWHESADIREAQRSFLEKRQPLFWKIRKSDLAALEQAREGGPERRKLY